MQIDIATPAMLFPAISLLLLAYTNRFLTLATIIRNFARENRDENTEAQIRNLAPTNPFYQANANCRCSELFSLCAVDVGDLPDVSGSR